VGLGGRAAPAAYGRERVGVHVSERQHSPHPAPPAPRTLSITSSSRGNTAAATWMPLSANTAENMTLEHRLRVRATRTLSHRDTGVHICQSRGHNGEGLLGVVTVLQ
jgi:hypothetical protein